MQDYEKLGSFYLGREYDISSGSMQDDLLLYDSKDLTTHAMCVGMTGSGKTGLCIGLLEEAAIDNIPAIIIDPKGDLSNLLLQFENLTPEEFQPWVNEDDARKKDISVAEYAKKQADLWKNGIADWGQDKSRIKRLKDSAEFVVYTPGSSAGLSVSILSSFAAPKKEILEDNDLLRESINTTVTSLLGLLDIDADPIQSREHILLSNILETSWRNGQNLDLAGIIQAIQQPPVSRIGVFEIESFFPSKERFAFAMLINNLLAAPSFQSWFEGEALDVDNLLHTSAGKTKVSIFSIAHLNDTERMFFVSLLLTQVLGWMRTQSGTSSLRALLYMDEIYGYIPPVANPPSKAPLLTLLKQARAFGLGVVLATQNPVDLDYKGLSNMGTWFIGRLQTERDKKRVLDGLESADSSAGGRFDRKKMEKLLSSLGKRVFLMNNVHEDQPVTFHTRWVLSYLRGPLTRNQIKLLMKDYKKTPAIELINQTSKAPATLIKKKSAVKVSSKPILPPSIPEYFLPLNTEVSENDKLIYVPLLLGIGTVYYANAKAGLTAENKIALFTDLSDMSISSPWRDSYQTKLLLEDLDKLPDEDVFEFDELPGIAAKKKSYTGWSKRFKDWLYRNQKLELLKCTSLGIVSSPDESERDFRVRLQLTAHEKRDELIGKLRKKYNSKIANLEDRISRATRAVDREKEQEKQQKFQTVISFGTTLLGALLGRKASTIGGASSTARRAGQIYKEKRDVKRASENVEDLQRRLVELNEQLESEIEMIETSMNPMQETFQTIQIKPLKKDISISLVALTWVPHYRDSNGNLTSGWQE